jgi:hypothetical protein
MRLRFATQGTAGPRDLFPWRIHCLECRRDLDHFSRQNSGGLRFELSA